MELALRITVGPGLLARRRAPVLVLDSILLHGLLEAHDANVPVRLDKLPLCEVRVGLARGIAPLHLLGLLVHACTLLCFSASLHYATTHASMYAS